MGRLDEHEGQYEKGARDSDIKCGDEYHQFPHQNYARYAQPAGPSYAYQDPQYNQQPPFTDLPPPYESHISPPPKSAPIIQPQNALHNTSKLIAIPATSNKLGSPFLRAYPPVLEQSNVSPDTFLQFLDHLNRAAVASPPVQVLGLAGTVTGFVPLATAQIVGNAVSSAASLATMVMSKSRTEILLREANRDVFGPRGLQVQIAKLEVVAKLSGMPVLDAAGKLMKNTSILGALEDDNDLNSLSAQQRRIQALSPWLAPLQIEALPEIDRPQNAFSRMHAKASEHQRGREESKMIKDRGKVHKDVSKDTRKAEEDYEKEMRKLDKDEERERRKEKKPHKLEEKMRDIEKKRGKVEREYEKEMGKIDKDRRKDDKEEKSLRKILFLIVTQGVAQ